MVIITGKSVILMGKSNRIMAQTCMLLDAVAKASNKTTSELGLYLINTILRKESENESKRTE